MKYVLVFLAVMLLDWLWSKYTIAATRRDAWSAGGYSVCLYLVGAYATVQYVHDWHVLPAALAGAFIGTVLGVRK